MNISDPTTAQSMHFLITFRKHSMYHPLCNQSTSVIGWCSYHRVTPCWIPSLYQPFPPAKGNKGIQCDCRAPSATSCLCASMVSRSQLTLISEDIKKSALLDDRYRARPPVISGASLAYGFSQSSNTSVDTIPGITVNALIFG